MAQQAPLSKSLNVQNSSTCPLTLANGFITCSSITPNTFAVDPNFRLGYAQNWQLSVQDDLPAALQLDVTYLGHQGDTRRAGIPAEYVPNRRCKSMSFLPGGFCLSLHRTAIRLARREKFNCEEDCVAVLLPRCNIPIRNRSTMIPCWAVRDLSQPVEQPRTRIRVNLRFAATPTIAQNWLDLQLRTGTLNL